MFPHWEQFIPMLGTFYSHAGNVLFPRWERINEFLDPMLALDTFVW